ncbi:hypothetical protein FNV43_RR10973 [Rhamnella rubrinervis]|uniref:Uncharacterized protein n=1 Tax=Rhamnella rubrinervis TaxID=2594499 RepID=A0A8K0H4Y0_9ROSA|nr:hypothetical protein FNV43_RR10973 [Rhamnella rubrinervis]
MKGRETKGAPSADLLVCFPSRAHLSLMPKPICSPARPSENNKRHHSHHHHHHHHLKKSTTRGLGQASPLLWSKTTSIGSEISEPTSPKVTCAGQIKVRHKTSSCKSWQSVMEEIERIHSNRQQHKKRPSWVEALGFKKDIMQFLTCLRNIRFDFRCFGSFHESDVTTDEDDDEEEDEDQYHENHVVVEATEDTETSRTVFSKWFMVLQEDQNNGLRKELDKKEIDSHGVEEDGSAACAPAVPPPNALLLMRCRSAPAKSWLEEKKEEEDQQDDIEYAEELEKENIREKKRKSKELEVFDGGREEKEQREPYTDEIRH